MPIEIVMPKLSDTMEEGMVLEWRVQKGDTVCRGDVIAEVETDKAAMEMEAFEDGVVSDLKVGSGETVPVGTVIAVLSREGEAGEVKEPAGEPEPRRRVTPAEARVVTEEAGQGVGVSPAARKLARERGVDLGRLHGSGPGGRIVLADVENAAAKPGKTPPEEEPEMPLRRAEKAIEGGGKSVKIRRLVARKMAESWQTIPHFFVTVAVDMTDVIRFRKDLGVSINDFILAAVARSLKEHPWVNSHWSDGEAVEQDSINLAMAVATERGLYNPVIKDCAPLPLKEISARAADLADRAHRGKLSEEDLADGTITITNMGMLGVESFSAIITPPQAAVLAVGTVKGEVVIDEREEPGIAPMVRLTLSADHRILDGADAAEFLATVKAYLEAPITLVTCSDTMERR